MSETASAKDAGSPAGGSGPSGGKRGNARSAGGSGGEKAKATAETLRDGAGDGYAHARDRAADAYVGAMESGASLFRSAREQGAATLEAALDVADEARERATRQLENNPLVALIGGMAIGAVAGALLPRTQAEARALGDIGGKLTDAARAAAKEAAEAAKTAGRDSLGDMMLGRDAVGTAVNKLIEAAFAAATSAGSAALRTPPRDGNDSQA